MQASQKPTPYIFVPLHFLFSRLSPPITLRLLRNPIALDRADEALGEEGPDGAYDGEDGGGGD